MAVSNVIGYVIFKVTNVGATFFAAPKTHPFGLSHAPCKKQNPTCTALPVRIRTFDGLAVPPYVGIPSNNWCMDRWGGCRSAHFPVSATDRPLGGGASV